MIAQLVIKKTNLLLTTNSSTVTCLREIVSIERVKCRPLLDTGAGSSYVPSKFSLINKKSVRTETKTI